MTRFKILRVQKGYTQEEFRCAYNSKYGRTYTAAAISQIENDKRTPEISALKDFADFYGVSIDYLLGRDIIEKTVSLEETKKEHEGSLMKLCEDELFSDRPDILNVLKGGQIHDIYDGEANKKTLANLTPEDKEMIKTGVLTLLKAAGLIEK